MEDMKRNETKKNYWQGFYFYFGHWRRTFPAKSKLPIRDSSEKRGQSEIEYQHDLPFFSSHNYRPRITPKLTPSI